MRWIWIVVLGACASEVIEVGPVSCDGDAVVCAGEAVCEGDLDAYVVCGREGPYCRKHEGYVDAPVDLTPVCVSSARSPK